MDNRKTVIRSRPSGSATQIVSPIDATYTPRDKRQKTRRFVVAFRIGRQEDCDIQMAEDVVSRHHAEVFYDGLSWWIRDLDSANGLYVNGRLVKQAQLAGRTEVKLGTEGPLIWLETADGMAPEERDRSSTPTEFLQRHLSPQRTEGNTEYSNLVRTAFAKATSKQRRKYLYLVSALTLVLAATVTVALYQQHRLQRMHALAVEIFYNMKEVELQVASLEKAMKRWGDTAGAQALDERRRELAAMTTRYDDFLDELGVFASDLSETDRLILRIARIFGECELDAPKGFTDEVRAYIAKWQTTKRYENAIRRAETNGFTEITRTEMLANHLPPQFFYLALKESDFREQAVGPPTRFGIAKGAWQFIPDTALRYGLRTGPLVEESVFDPKDERHDFSKSTHAAARYLGDIYTTEAQASGLLVMASYNWGENNIRRLVQRLPMNPRDRNFWQLLKQHKIPAETYDYVMYIFAAAVIGENPRHFGFDLDDPLADL